MVGLSGPDGLDENVHTSVVVAGLGVVEQTLQRRSSGQVVCLGREACSRRT
jgi:hypothetical protein